MSNWNRIIKFPEFAKIKAFYNERFPLEVRIVCAQWIEEQIKTNESIYDVNCPQYKLIATQFIKNLIQKLVIAIQRLEPEEFAMKCRLEDAVHKFWFMENNISVIRWYGYIRDVITYEKHFLDVMSSKAHQIDSNIIEKIKTLTNMNNLKLVIMLLCGYGLRV